ncbi:MAG: hypothetical protein GX998_10155 [Firmicutes bacterium]|nr:hypothetical protein [Bacillota bacterium]
MNGWLQSRSSRLLLTTGMIMCLVLTAGAYGKAKESGGEPLSILRFGTTARIWGMGNAGVAAARGVEGLYYNPAALCDVKQPELSISHAAWLVETDLNFMAAALPLADQGGLGAGLLLLSSPGIPATSDEGALEGYFDYLQGVVYVSAGRAISDDWEMGVTAKGLFGEVEAESCRGYSLEGGLRFKVSEMLTLGILARDVWGKVQWTTGLTEAIPTQILGGAVVSLLDGQLLVSGQTDTGFKDRGIGAEYSIGEHVQLRGGYAKESITAGVGLGVGNIRLDYSWVGHDLGGTHRISFAVRF